MARTQADIEADLAVVRSAKLSGAQAKQLTFSDGRTIIRPSWNYLDQLEQQFARELRATQRRPRQYRVYTSRGLD